MFKKLLSTAFVVSLYLVVAKILGLSKEMIVARQYGVSEYVDAYSFLFNIFTLPSAIFFSVLTVVLIPILVKANAVKKILFVRSFTIRYLAFSMFTFLTLVIGLYLVKDNFYILRTVFENKELRGMYYLLSPIVILSMLTCYFSILLMAKNRHVNTLYEGIPALAIIVSIFFGGGLAWGTFIGFIIYILVISGTTFNIREVKLARALNIESRTNDEELWTKLIKGLSTVVISQIVIAGTGVIDQFFLANSSSGSLSIYNYYIKLLSIVLTVGVIVITRSCLTTFSTANDERKIRSVCNRVGFFVLMISSFILFIPESLMHLGVEVIYGGGQFSNNDVSSVSSLLTLGAVQIPFYFSSMVYLAYFSSREYYKPLLLTSVTAFLVKLFYLKFFTAGNSIDEVIVSTNIMYFVNFVLLLLWVNKNNESS